MAGNEDVDGDVSGEEAAWRDLVARFDLPVDTEAAEAPWPARENLTETARDRQRTEPDAEGGWDEPGAASSGGRPGPASLPARPAGGRWPEATDEAGPDTAPEKTDTEAGPAPETTSPGAASPGPASPGGAASAGGASPAVSGTGRADRPRIIRRAGPGRPDQVADAGQDDEDEDDRYVPPPPDPLPPLDPTAKGAWAGVLGGPGYLLIAKLADWQIPSWAALVAIVAFVAGFATLVVRMGDKPRDDDDDGAVV